MNLIIIPASLAPALQSVLRVVAGLLFLEHGTGKLLGFPAWLPFIDKMPEGMVDFTGTLELVGGVLIVLGLFTRPVAFVLAGFMAVAYFMAHFPMSFFPAKNTGEPAVLYCFVFLYLAAAGPGPWSIDRIEHQAPRREGNRTARGSPRADFLSAPRSTTVAVARKSPAFGGRAEERVEAATRDKAGRRLVRRRAGPTAATRPDVRGSASAAGAPSARPRARATRRRPRPAGGSSVRASAPGGGGPSRPCVITLGNGPTSSAEGAGAARRWRPRRGVAQPARDRTRWRPDDPSASGGSTARWAAGPAATGAIADCDGTRSAGRTGGSGTSSSGRPAD